MCKPWDKADNMTLFRYVKEALRDGREPTDELREAVIAWLRPYMEERRRKEDEAMQESFTRIAKEVGERQLRELDERADLKRLRAKYPDA